MAEDSIEKINTGIIGKIKERGVEEYQTSYIARIINRTLAGEVSKTVDPNFRKGHYSSAGTVAESAGSNPSFEIEGRHLRLEGETLLLGTFGSEEVMDELDETVSKLSNRARSADDVYRLGALITAIIGTAHPFPDGNGRTSVGVAKLIIEHLLPGRTISLERLQRYNDDLKHSMAMVSLLLLPKHLNPSELISEMKKLGENSKVVRMPDPRDYEECIKYFSDYKSEIIQFMREYEFDKGDGNRLNVLTQIDCIADLYEQSVL